MGGHKLVFTFNLVRGLVFTCNSVGGHRLVFTFNSLGGDGLVFTFNSVGGLVSRGLQDDGLSSAPGLRPKETAVRRREDAVPSLPSGDSTLAHGGGQYISLYVDKEVTAAITDQQYE